jgi:uncharacterized membrane protein
MKKWCLTISVFALLAGYRPGASIAQSNTPVSNVGDKVRTIFAIKCAGCHGPELTKPKGRFGYVLDLHRVAENPEMVIPLRPDESELWVLIDRNEMPPSDSPHGSLNQQQKEVIRAWIAAGAPDVTQFEFHPPLVAGSEPMPPASVELDPVDRAARWMGKFHLLLLHFPIALVFAAGFAELLSLRGPTSIPSESVRFCLMLGAISAIPTAGLGWLYAATGNGASSSQLLMAHRWLGTTAAVYLVITAVCAERDARNGVRSRGVRLLILFDILMVGFTAHLGGLLDHGGDFFTY